MSSRLCCVGNTAMTFSPALNLEYKNGEELEMT